MRAYFKARKTKNKDDIELLLTLNKKNSNHQIRSKAQTLEWLNASQEGDFSWVQQLDKRAKIRSFTNEDELVLAEQLFYYYVQVNPERGKAAYWLSQLKNMNHEDIETGLLSALFEDAENSLKQLPKHRQKLNLVYLNQVHVFKPIPIRLNPPPRFV